MTLTMQDKHKYVEITDDFSPKQFEFVKQFILENGDRQTYRNIDSNNPHYSFEGINVYLNSEHRNGNIDQKISEFNEITIRDFGATIQYYTIRIVRQGDIANPKIHIDNAMQENKVYLMNDYGEDIQFMKKALIGIYLKKIETEIYLKKGRKQ